jgi:hypothetical protein
LSINTTSAQVFELGSWNILNFKYNNNEKWSVFGEAQLRSLNFYNNFHYYEYKGGIFKSTDNGVTWTDLSHNINISMVNRIGLSQTDATKINAGMQDNGTNFKTGTTWNNIYGGDGGESIIDHSDNNTLYFCYVKSELHRSDDGGASENQITTGLPHGTTQDFYSSFHQDPTVSTRIYAGGNIQLYRTNDKGATWTMLGTPTGTGNITEFAVSPSNNQIIYTVKENAVSKSIDGGTNFTNITGTLPVGSASPVMVTVSNTNPLKVWVVFSGYSAANKVFKSVDGGTTWINITGTLPNLPMTTVVYTNGSANDAIYVGSDIGIYYMDNITPWVSYFTNLPNVAVRDLEIQYATSKIRAATYGRGVWESPLFANTPTPVTIKTFTGETKNVNNILYWTVAQEDNLASYDVQRSNDAINFKTIANVKANGTSTESSYNFADTKPFNGTNYYRLQANDIDGEKITQISLTYIYLKKSHTYIQILHMTI